MASIVRSRVAVAPRGPVVRLPRPGALTAAYRRIEREYARLEALSHRQRALLRAGCGLGEVRSLMARKRALLDAIRSEEMRVAGERGDRSPRETRELLRLFDRVGVRIERVHALESDCRALLARTAGPRVADDVARTWEAVRSAETVPTLTNSS